MDPVAAVEAALDAAIAAAPEAATRLEPDAPLTRATSLPAADPLRDGLLSLTASCEDPVSGGRHKVWGSRPLWVPPQTSTIGSHLPRAVGAAFAIARKRRLGSMSGRGVEATIDGVAVVVSGPALLRERDLTVPDELRAATGSWKERGAAVLHVVGTKRRSAPSP